MRNVRKVLSFSGGSEGGDSKKERNKTDSDSELMSISRGCDGVPESVGGYELEMNSRINVRWVNDEEEIRVECSSTGDGWRTKARVDGKTYVVSSHGSLDEAIETAESVMLGERQQEDDEGNADTRSDFEKEVDAVLSDADTESVEAVVEAFGD